MCCTGVRNGGAFVQPLLQWRSNNCYILWVCVCSLRYRECNALAPYCHLWHVRLYNIFPDYVIRGTIFEKNIDYKMCVLFFSTDFVWNISHSKKNWTRCDKKCTHIGLHVQYRYCCQILMNLEFSGQIFEKYWNTKFSKNPSCGGGVIPYGQTDRHDEGNSRCS